MDLVSKVDETESRLRSERNTTPSTVGEQNQKLNNLYIKIGRLCEENDTLKENIAALKDRERKKEELCETCKVKETEIAELQEQLGPVGESSEENKDIGARAKNDPDEDVALAGLRIAYFRAEEDLRIKDSEHAAEIAKIREEHETIINYLQLGLRDARTATKKEHAEKLCTQEQLSNTTKELSDTKKQLFHLEKQYRILCDIIPKPGGGEMVEPHPPTKPRLSQSREMDSFSSSVTPFLRLERTSRSHGSHDQGHEIPPSPSHTSNGSRFSLEQDSE
ncbi:hypothetical protein J4E90_008988 [Alternaria incomplexa]|uniref:uncharacterized protein n=1 Tax=Alternaria incomplexa TaxID=1187928 RepID=UPI0022208075|nr:uncharacterized protein J4E90_008988 [Alternaria incomplexa]KAI4908363.1 hypothetical protein J4E90_008988 [Alternaria incomplexa]